MAVTWDAAKIEAKARAAVTRAVVAVAEDVLATGTSLIASPPKTGRVYQRTLPRRTHQASAPGEPPAADLGGLIASGHVIGPTQAPSSVTATIAWTADYALPLELGTEKMAPRPFARPALDAVAPSIEATLRAEIEREFGA
jgi:HK97 gp10 family phage protein